MKSIEEILKNVNPRDLINAKVMDDGKKKDKTFLVVGKDEDGLYAIRITPKNQRKNENYYKGKYKLDDKPYYFRWNTIFKLSEKEFMRKRYKIPLEVYRYIIHIVSQESKTFEHIDFESADFPLKKNSIILKDDDLYIVTKKLKGTDDFKIVKLEEDEGNENGISIKGSKYVLGDETDVINIYDDYIVIGFDSENTHGYVNNSECYEFGDVLALKNSNEKVIYLTEINDMVYYATFEQLELFTGISKINKDKIAGFFRKLDDCELNKITTKIERPLSNGSYPLYGEAIEDILNSVKQLKKQ